MLPDDTSFITDEAALRALHHAPMSRATDKVLRALDAHCRRIVELSPFCVIATQGPRGADVSPRGDPPGFVRIIDDATLLLPDRVGNNRLDGMTNLIANPRIGMLFFVPGMNETLRINGTARITDDRAPAGRMRRQRPRPEGRPRHRGGGGVPALRQGAGAVPAVGRQPPHRSRQPAELRRDAARPRRRPDAQRRTSAKARSWPSAGSIRSSLREALTHALQAF